MRARRRRPTAIVAVNGTTRLHTAAATAYDEYVLEGMKDVRRIVDFQGLRISRLVG